jgi:hypothetical protein
LCFLTSHYRLRIRLPVAGRPGRFLAADPGRPVPGWATVLSGWPVRVIGREERTMAASGNRSEAPGAIRAVPAEADDPTWDRLEDQIRWYSRKSGESQRFYKWLKLLEIAVAAALPVVAAVRSPVWVTGGLAAVIVVLEGAQHVYQFQEHWITYRSTAEELKHERYLYIAHAGPYTGDDRHDQLAERLEGLISQEHARWTYSHRSSDHQQPGQ